MLVLVALAIAPGSAVAQANSFKRPTAHFRVPEPASLGDEEAEALYLQLQDDLIAAYRMSGHPAAERYIRWRRFNRVPFRSATHGERFINTYANGVGQLYGSTRVSMPPGAIVAKDSFTVTADGDVYPGPLFLMEKMRPGFASEARDWRYTMIMPDGSFFGETEGVGHERMIFCITCHQAAGDAADHLFSVPPLYRLDPGRGE